MLGLEKRDKQLSHLMRQQLAKNPEPFAIVLSCSDSRAPTEIVFDQGVGDLFVIRVAGNIVGPTQYDSIAFAAVQFGIRLIVVLGHTHCGAVLAALEQLRQPTESNWHIPKSITTHIRPAVEGLLRTELRYDVDALNLRAVRENIKASVRHLRGASKFLQQLTQNGGIHVVGAEYSVETGEVDFFDVSEVPSKSEVA
jgi:carbonic anhydrase